MIAFPCPSSCERGEQRAPSLPSLLSSPLSPFRYAVRLLLHTTLYHLYATLTATLVGLLPSSPTVKLAPPAQLLPSSVTLLVAFTKTGTNPPGGTACIRWPITRNIESMTPPWHVRERMDEGEVAKSCAREGEVSKRRGRGRENTCLVEHLLDPQSLLCVRFAEEGVVELILLGVGGRSARGEERGREGGNAQTRRTVPQGRRMGIGRR